MRNLESRIISTPNTRCRTPGVPEGLGFAELDDTALTDPAVAFVSRDRKHGDEHARAPAAWPGTHGIQGRFSVIRLRMVTPSGADLSH